MNIIDSVNMDNGEDQPYVKLMVIGQARITFKINTGAQANIIPERNFKTLKAPISRRFLGRVVLQYKELSISSFCSSASGLGMPVH